jgi:hypothetical protein
MFSPVKPQVQKTLTAPRASPLAANTKPVMAGSGGFVVDGEKEEHRDIRV